MIPSNFKIPISEAASTWTQTSEADFNNGVLNNLSIAGIGEDAELRLDFSNINEDSIRQSP